VTPRLLLFAVAALATGCPTANDDDSAVANDDDSVAVDPLGFAVDEPGPFHVGWRQLPTTYTPAGATEARSTDVAVWYPTEDLTGEPATYLLGIDQDAFVDASLAPPLYDGRYPVMVYSHGSQGWAGTSNDLSRWFASHGWVVVAPQHYGNTFTDNSRAGTAAHYLERPGDVSAALDLLEALPGSDPLAGLASTDRVLLTGHSRGAYSVWSVAGATYDATAVASACDTPDFDAPCTDAEEAAFLAGLGDERIAASIPMAGGIRRQFFGPTGHRGVSHPVLWMTGSEDEGTPGSHLAQWGEFDDIDLRWVDVDGGCHQTFALGTPCGTLSAEEGWRIVDTWALAFGRAHVLGDDDATTLGILDGTVEVSERVTLRILE